MIHGAGVTPAEDESDEEEIAHGAGFTPEGVTDDLSANCVADAAEDSQGANSQHF